MKSFCAWEAVVSHENLWRAYKAFSKGKRRRRDVATFDLSAPSQVLHLARRLQEGNWQPGGYKLLRISDPKRRIISCAPVADRVVHHALHQVVAPLLNRRFIEHSYACLPGRGSHRALLHFQRMMREHAYVLKLDIGRYFYSIDQDRLYALLCTRLREAPLRELIRRILHSGRGLYQRRTVQEWLGWDGPMPLHCGLPIGNLTSQWWGNLYLDGADHHVLRNLKLGGYQRYMDDMALADDDPGRLLAHRDALAEWLCQTPL